MQWLCNYVRLSGKGGGISLRSHCQGEEQIQKAWIPKPTQTKGVLFELGFYRPAWENSNSNRGLLIIVYRSMNLLCQLWINCTQGLGRERLGSRQVTFQERLRPLTLEFRLNPLTCQSVTVPCATVVVCTHLPLTLQNKTERKKKMRHQRPRTYESPRKSWNLIRPMVVSASKLGNTSPSKSPGMVAPSLQFGLRKGWGRNQVGTYSWSHRETTWTNPEVGGPQSKIRQHILQSQSRDVLPVTNGKWTANKAFRHFCDNKKRFTLADKSE